MCGQKETKVSAKWYRRHVAEWGGGGGGGGGRSIKSDEEMSNMSNRKLLLHISPLTRER